MKAAINVSAVGPFRGSTKPTITSCHLAPDFVEENVGSQRIGILGSTLLVLTKSRMPSARRMRRDLTNDVQVTQNMNTHPTTATSAYIGVDIVQLELDADAMMGAGWLMVRAES